MKNLLNSYSAASIYPIKLIHYKVVNEDRKIMPVHVQLNLTNKCNLLCTYCSCVNRDKSLEADYSKVICTMNRYKEVGCKSVTITGGGEPLLHNKINEIIKYIKYIEISIGLVTNGIAINKLHAYRYITWIRVSFDDDREFNEEFEKNLTEAINQSPDVDWAFSYVLSPKPNYKNIQKVIKFANRHNFTHVRLVSNLLDLDSAPVMSWTKVYIKNLGVDDSRVIYQGRKSFTKGTERCLISLLKPVVDVDGTLYPCCGTQYSTEQPTKGFDKRISMGNVNEIREIFDKQRYYNGSSCVRCYYSNYNSILEDVTKEIAHVEFV